MQCHDELRCLCFRQAIINLLGVTSGCDNASLAQNPKLLRQYERARKADFAMMGQANDALQQVLTRAHPALQALRNWGMNRFDQSGPIKHWVASRAMGATGNTRSKD